MDLGKSFQQKVQVVIDLFKKELPKVKKINALVLFGSFARGVYSVRHSDVDLMIFLNQTQKNSALEEHIKKKIVQLSLGKAVSVHPIFQYCNIEQEDKSLMLTIAKEGEVLFARKTLVISGNILSYIL